MRRSLICCALPVLLAACWPAAVDAGKPPPFTVGAIGATFVPSAFATEYRITWTQPPWKSAPGIKPRVIWTLHLQIVDGDAGKPYLELPGSGGAVDPGCNNAGVGTSHPFDGSRVHLIYRVTETKTASVGDPFTWHHPDPAESRPPGVYHCNHNDMGPHGHQGLITVTVTADHYGCTAHYLGTNTGTGDDRAQRPEGVPTCRASG